jgi:hypothetical protein
MPDITMCRNQFCTIKDRCYRWTAEPNPHWQSYAWFKEPSSNEKCLNFFEDVRKNVTDNVEHTQVVDNI